MLPGSHAYEPYDGFLRLVAMFTRACVTHVTLASVVKLMVARF